MKKRSLLLALLFSCCMCTPAALGPVAPAPGQPAGALAGRIIYAGARHGWVYDPSSWRLMRPVLLDMNEDSNNQDQMTLFAYYCFNAGATVVPLRPVGDQTNEVVLDNDDPSVTFAGAWAADTTSTVYYGSPGDVRFLVATLSATETATATYTPNIRVTGFYPVYTWVPHGADRTSQLYRIRHTGGEATVRVPHYMVGNGWVYLGTYYFQAGSSSTNGAVIISNLAATPSVGSVVIADAVRFGNGMGSIDRGGGVSTYPREEEAIRYWVQNSLGQGQSSGLYDVPGSGDETDDFGAVARMVREMNREQSGTIYERLYIGFHSNAFDGTARGSLAVYNQTVSQRTPNQLRLAQICGRTVTDDMVAMNGQMEFSWYDRGSGATYPAPDFSEINTNLNNELDATIIEVAFHDNASDAKLLRDPKVRTWVARAAYHAVIKYMNEFDGFPLNYLPEPPYNLRVLATTNGIVLSWNLPVAQAGSGAPTNYVIYRSTDGYGFGNPVSAAGGGTTSFTLTNLAADTDYYFRVSAANAAGESMPSEVGGCRRASNPRQSRILVVNAFDRFDRTTNLRESATPRGYVPPGNSGTFDRVRPRANNSFDYVVQHGKAISDLGMPFDSCQRQAVTNGMAALANYQIVVWAAGQSLTNTFRAPERNVLTSFQDAGGHLFVSGADIAWDLDRASGPAGADRAFLHNQLHASLSVDADNNSASYTVTPAAALVFAGLANGDFDNGTRGIYWVQNPDVLTPTGPGVATALSYVGGRGGAAAIQYDGSAGGGKVVYCGFPFETLTVPSVRNAYMARILKFFSQPVRLESLAFLADNHPRLQLSGEPGLTYAIEASSNLTDWVTLDNVTNTNGTIEWTDPSLANGRRFYRARLSF